MQRREHDWARRRRCYGVVIAAVLMAGCGGDDDAVEADVTDGIVGDDAGDAGADGGATADGGDELPYGDPCVLVPASTVAGIVGGEVTSALANADDGLPGASCLYTVASGGTVSLSISAMADNFYDSYKSQAEGAGGIEAVDGLGDDAFVFGGSELTARAGEAMFQLQVFTTGTTADTGGAEIVRAAVEAIGG